MSASPTRYARRRNASATSLRSREDEAALRDAEPHASGADGTSSADRVRRLWRAVAGPTGDVGRRRTRGRRRDRRLPPNLWWPALAGALQSALAGHDQPLAAAATAGVVLARRCRRHGAPRRKSSPDERPVAAAATRMRPELRSAPSRRPRPSDPDWPDALAGTVALAARDALALAAEQAVGGPAETPRQGRRPRRRAAARRRRRFAGPRGAVGAALGPRSAPGVRSALPTRHRARIVGPPGFSPLPTRRTPGTRSQKAARMCLSTRISPTCPSRGAGANRWAVSRRQFFPRAIRRRARPWHGWSGRGPISTSCAGPPTTSSSSPAAGSFARSRVSPARSAWQPRACCATAARPN